MAQYRPFAIWDGVSAIPSGVTQIQDILIGVADRDYYNFGGFDWWAGADESLGYVIAYHNQDFSQPNPLNIPCGIGFLRSSSLTDASFLELFNHLMAKLSLTPILNANDAKAWLLDNGYWTSYGERPWREIGNSDGEWFFYSDAGVLDVGPPVNNGNVVFTRDNLSFETFNPNKTGEDSSNSIFFSLFDSNGNDYTTQFTDLQDNGGSLTITQGDQTVTYTSEGALFVFNVSTTPQGNFFFLNVIAATQTQIATADFNLTDPITITFNEGSQLPRAIITSNNEYISVDEGLYLAYNI